MNSNFGATRHLPSSICQENATFVSFAVDISGEFDTRTTGHCLVWSAYLTEICLDSKLSNFILLKPKQMIALDSVYG